MKNAHRDETRQRAAREIPALRFNLFFMIKGHDDSKYAEDRIQKNMNVLLVEDETEMANIVRKGLERDAYTVDVAADGASGLGKAIGGKYALIVLDLMLPVVDGLTVCRRLREQRCAAPILMLTARDSIEDRVQGFETGADDYLPKPFHINELLARAKALIRRHRSTRSRLIRVDDLEIDSAGQHATRGGRELALTLREYTLLEALAARQGQVLTREFIQERIWEDEEAASNTVDVYIGLLRKKIDTGQTRKLIHTVYGQGYMMKDTRREGE